MYDVRSVALKSLSNWSEECGLRHAEHEQSGILNHVAEEEQVTRGNEN